MVKAKITEWRVRQAHNEIRGMLLRRMDEIEVNTTSLAVRMNRADGTIGRMLNGSTGDGLTLASVVRLAAALGCAVEIKLVPKTKLPLNLS